MLYQVKEKYPRGGDTLIAQFNRLNDAKLFIERKLMADEQMRNSVNYKLFEGIDLLEEFVPGGESSQGAGSSSSTGQTTGFRPSPLQTSPRPTGMPPSSFRDENKDKSE